jgi:GNAT superfamily N-acetyltransferase
VVDATAAGGPALLRSAVTPEDYAAFGRLIDEYQAWLRVRYADDPWFIDQVFSHQGLSQELQGLPQMYGPPGGRTLLAERDGIVCGGGAFRRLTHNACEMKRLFVPQRHAGSGIGTRLCEALVAAARAGGYRVMRLDTARRLTEAIALYRKLGFRDCAPYHDYPQRLQGYIQFMERPLEP